VTRGVKQLCVHQLVSEQARRTPQAVAVWFDGQSLTYAQVETRANRLAHHLRRLGVGPDVLVGLCIERSLDLPVALLGILKGGGAYVPLDPSFPQQRLAFLLEDSQAPVLVTQSHLLAGLPPHHASVVVLDGAWRKDPDLPEHEPDSGVDLHHLAYVIYTSGSTGTPKGVLLEHGSACNGLSRMRDLLGISGGDVVLAVCSIAVDLAWLDLCLPLSAGGQVAVLSGEDIMFGRQIAHRLAEAGATFMEATPVTWRLLLDAGWEGSEGLQMLSSGEALTEDLAERLLNRGARLWNGYGASEGGIMTTMHEVRPGERPVRIGRPIASLAVYLLDENQSAVEKGKEGEIYVSGVGVARGYLNRPELTAERFLPDPFAERPGATMYRTGDLARCLPDGTLEYLGRADHQVKIRGFRVELGEIEANLLQYPDVAQAVVVAREDDPGDRRLVAYVVLEEGSTARPLELRRYLKDTLPPYMVPTAVVMLPEFPLTPNRKVDRLALPPP
jgi:amino acid adenylation domain-containing protein